MSDARDKDTFGTLRPLTIPGVGEVGRMHLLQVLEQQGLGSISRLPVSLRMLLEAMVRNCDGIRVLPEHVRSLCACNPTGSRTEELPFVPARILLQDLNGVPLMADLAAMRDVARASGIPASVIEPQVPVDMVVDHSVQVDHFGVRESLTRNMSEEFERNRERFEFLKWSEKAFKGVKVIEPGVGARIVNSAFGVERNVPVAGAGLELPTGQCAGAFHQCRFPGACSRVFREARATLRTRVALR